MLASRRRIVGASRIEIFQGLSCVVGFVPADEGAWLPVGAGNTPSFVTFTGDGASKGEVGSGFFASGGAGDTRGLAICLREASAFS